MARQWFIPSGVMPLSGVMIEEDGTEEYFIPALGMFNEDQAAAGGDGTDMAWPATAVPMSTPIQVIGY